MSNIDIKKVKSDDRYIIDEIVSIHLATFKGFFLTFMGKGFLKQMYKSYTEHSQSDILVAACDGETVGFLAYSENMSGLYKYMIKHHLIRFAWYSFGAFLRKPKVFMRLVRAFLKPGESVRKENYVELASIGTKPDSKSKGVGSSLIDALKNEVDYSKFDYITLETDAIDNEIANNFYKKNGFYIHREYETNEGRKMFEYRYEGDKNEKDAIHTEYSKKS
ncbi:MAG: GNAT family N-acetyltransferase [Clostridia bacterium]|nr:GNAT family N-acetyltransferase [Clostridia bacterium]